MDWQNKEQGESNKGVWILNHFFFFFKMISGKEYFCFSFTFTFTDALQDNFTPCTSHGSLAVWYVSWWALALLSCLVISTTWPAHHSEELHQWFSHKSPHKKEVYSTCIIKWNNFFLFFPQRGHYVWNKRDLLSINPSSADYLLGEFFTCML